MTNRLTRYAPSIVTLPWVMIFILAIMLATRMTQPAFYWGLP